MTEEQKIKIKSEAREFASSNFPQKEVDSFYKRNSDRMLRTFLESDVLEIIESRLAGNGRQPLMSHPFP